MAVTFGNRGQAAVTDALYFLLIVSVLSVMLLYTAAYYGQGASNELLRSFDAEYATSTLKTILYSSTPRHIGESLETAEEIDYLFTMVKEDYADDKEIDDTKDVLRDNIRGILDPNVDHYDYMFYIYIPARGFIYFMLYRSDFDAQTDEIYYCKPDSLDDLDELRLQVGATAQSDTMMRFVILKEQGTRYDLPTAHINLTLWIPTRLDDFLLANTLKCECSQRFEKDGTWMSC